MCAVVEIKMLQPRCYSKHITGFSGDAKFAGKSAFSTWVFDVGFRRGASTWVFGVIRHVAYEEARRRQRDRRRFHLNETGPCGRQADC